MADQATIDLFHRALNYGLQSLGFANISLKEKQYEVLRELVVKIVEQRCFGGIAHRLRKILNLSTVATGAEFHGVIIREKVSVIVISPLNALIRDQIVKIREAGLNVCM